jgi:phospholipid-binding lipoprotein MlaA
VIPALFHRYKPTRFIVLGAVAFLAGGLAGCATPPPANDPDAVADFRQTNDPLEPTNRVFYKINNGIDTVVLKPVAQAYRAAAQSGSYGYS